MANVTIGVGAELDLASGEDVKQMGEQLFHRLRRKPRKWRFTRVQASQIIAAAPPAAQILNLGGPSQGRVWAVVSVCATGADDHTAVANTSVATYIGDPDAVNLTGLIATGVPVPNTASFPRLQFLVRPNEKLFLAFYGAALNTILTGTARVWDLPMDSDDLGEEF